MTKRILALLLCLALCLSLIPAAAAGDIDVSDEPEELAEKTPEALPEEEIALDEPGEPGEEIARDEPGEPGDEIGVIDPEEIAIPDEPEQAAPGPDAEIQATVVASGDCGEGMIWKLYDDGVLFVDGNGPMADFERYGAPWYEYRNQITEVSLDYGVQSVGEYAFADCTKIKRITSPGYGFEPYTLESIGRAAFLGCYAMTYLQLGSVETIGTQAFCYCYGLKRVTFTNAPEIGYLAFGDCRGLEEISFIGGVPSFHSSAFSSVNSSNAVHAKVWYPPDRTEWSEDVRQNYGGTLTWQAGYHGWCGDSIYWDFDRGSKTLTITGEGECWDVPGLGWTSFDYLRSDILTAIVGEGITSLGSGTMAWLCWMTSVTLPESLTEISDELFRLTPALTSITIPKNVTKIGSYAFTYFLDTEQDPKEIRFMGHAPEFDSKAFYQVTATAHYFPVPDWTSDILQQYGGTITWEKDDQIGDNVRWALNSLGCVNIWGYGPTWDFWDEPGFYYFRDEVTEVYFAPANGENYDWEEGRGSGITRIGDYLLWHLDSVTKITLPATLTEIGNYAFECAALEEVIFPGYAPSFGSDVFISAGSVTAYYYPLSSWTSDKLQDYGAAQVNWVCDNKCGAGGTGFYAPGNPDGQGANATWSFDEATGTLKVSGTGATKECTTGLGLFQSKYCILYYDQSCKKIVVEEGITRIGRALFQLMLSVEKIELPNTLTEIGREAFTMCWHCKEINLPSSLTKIEESAMSWMQELKSVSIQSGVTKLDQYAFFRCESMTSLTLPDTLTEIGEGVFGRCSALMSVFIPHSVQKIGKYAFSECTGLTSVRFRGHAPTIGENCFENVTATVYYYPVYTWTSDKLQQYNGTLTWNCDDKCGPNVTWYLDEDGTLTMTGTGNISDWHGYNPRFHYFHDEITSAVVGEGVTELGMDLFWNMDKLNRVSLPSTLERIDYEAFYKTGITAITIPASVTVIGIYAFGDCSALSEIRFLGSAPSFGDKCFRYDTATAYYPADDPSWTEDVRQQYGATKLTWMPYTPMTLNGDAISATLPVHDSMSLVVKDSGGTIVTDASWSTSDPGVATVDENGVITAVKYGKCTITASTEGGINTAECALQTLFWDVADSSKYYFKHVYWAAEKGITKGYDLEYFDPQGTCTREQMMTFLWRLAGQPNPKTTSSPFPDVKSGAYYYKAVLWGVEKGITNGYSSGPYAGKFGVGLPCTREQAMTFLWRMAGKPNPKSLTNKFSDVKSSDYFFKAVLWAAENGIANGYADGTYGVGLDCLREHMVTFLSRYASKFM